MIRTMLDGKNLFDPANFSNELYQLMQRINPGIQQMELYEFRYCLKELTPPEGWDSVRLEKLDEIEARVSSRDFYDGIQIKPMVNGRIALDENIVSLTQTLFAGLVSGVYSSEWVSALFYFDIRSFLFYHRTNYSTPEVLTHFGGEPYRQFEPAQRRFDAWEDLGYQDFMKANEEVDTLFFSCALKLTALRGTPLIFAIAGQTAAGKTEIVERLTDVFKKNGLKVTSIEVDNFLTDRDEREEKGINSEGKEALHFELFKQALLDIKAGNRISIPRYNFQDGSSSHDQNGKLKAGCDPVVIEPAEIVFIEGNFPFLIDEIVPLVGVKVVYLTDDPIRLKRKWKRDVDYRKKYDLSYFRNRYFKEQFIMAQVAYIPQLKTCDLAVDTTGARLWASKDVKSILDQSGKGSQ
jgi:uridine kinase